MDYHGLVLAFELADSCQYCYMLLDLIFPVPGVHAAARWPVFILAQLARWVWESIWAFFLDP